MSKSKLFSEKRAVICKDFKNRLNFSKWQSRCNLNRSKSSKLRKSHHYWTKKSKRWDNWFRRWRNCYKTWTWTRKMLWGKIFCWNRNLRKVRIWLGIWLATIRNRVRVSVRRKTRSNVRNKMRKMVRNRVKHRMDRHEHNFWRLRLWFFI